MDCTKLGSLVVRLDHWLGLGRAYKDKVSAMSTSTNMCVPLLITNYYGDS